MTVILETVNAAHTLSFSEKHTQKHGLEECYVKYLPSCLVPA